MVNLELDHGGLIWVVEDVEGPTLPLLASTDKLARLLEKPIPTQPQRHIANGETEPDASDSYNDELEVPQTPAQKLKSATSKLLGLMRNSPGKSAKENFLDLVGGDASDSEEDKDKERLMDSKIELSEAPPSPTKKFQSATSKLIGLMRSSPEKSAKENFLDLIGDNGSDSEDDEETEKLMSSKIEISEAPPSPTKKFQGATKKLLGMMRSAPEKSAKENFRDLVGDNPSDSEEEESPSYIGKEKLTEAPPSPSKKLKSATSKVCALIDCTLSTRQDQASHTRLSPPLTSYLDS